MGNVIRSIGILRLGALGDICLTVPLVRLLQKHLPQTEIYWIISRPLYSLVEGLSNVKFIVIDKPKTIADYWGCYLQFKSYYFDALLVPQATLRSNILCALTRAKVKYGYGKLHSRDLQRWFVNKTVTAKPEHLVESFLRFAEPFGIFDKEIDWRLPVEESDREWAKSQLASFPGKWVAICPGASKVERNWLSERYAAVVNQLKKQWDFNVVLIGGTSSLEKKMAQEISDQLDAPSLNLVGKSSLKRLTALLNEVDVLLSPDTGPLHIAQAMGTPVVGLYAVAPPEKTGPYFSQRWVVNKYPLAVKTILKKDPAKVSWHERVHSSNAMKLIEVSEVVSKLDELFSELFSKSG
ncbi:ADP-heptose--LPS heptosyltransferase [Coxiella burnetii]|uniref:ADP-heptose--LPS heptosyltransferase n=1 Tax=Coxiella burnetii (strain Dugway 5J108-111) TaxID=434922 RepID=A9KH23_COXBN|nr:glycosyltransferase family 9 protein [Coxiella burnetii]ABS77541.1 ADP-heptose--LPS heptosyltransferase [Coxiella burnetii Dugway 5J108-111]OYK79253.1 ADP-heptose--LPS heptosyltransferase [Coxiella burnetii]OYK81334.1 ADP-heptose--LPS heptosyltransferase [Coxiella burnetii]